jgi:ABC-2 type transport system permease protein
MNPKLLAVIKREYLQQIRSKAFWIATFLIPVLGIGIAGVQVVLHQQMIPKGAIAVVDLSGRLYTPLVAEAKAKKNAADKDAADESKIQFTKVEATAESLPKVRKRLNEDVQKERVKAYIVLDAKTIESGKAEWRAQSVKADFVLRDKVEDLLSRAATKERLKDHGVDPGVYEASRVHVDLDPHEAKEIEGETSKNLGANIAISGILFFLIYISIFIYGAFILRGVMEEKNNRIVEVIISSVRPTDLMLGKIIGIGCVGLTQFVVWAALAGSVTLPSVAALMGMSEGLPVIPVGTIVAFLVFFLLGFFLYGSMYAALAAPFNTQEEAQQFIMIPAVILILTSTTWVFTINSPNGLLAQALSFFPFTSPLIMFMRISVQPPPWWQVALSIAILLVSIRAMAWFAGRIYRVGILMYGKKPTLPEILRWVRQAD